MSFLNAALLGGLAAAAIPLILHLLNRRRFRVVRWGAMPFLDHLLRTNRRRLRLEQLLLLLVRTLLPVLLALAMARPVFRGLRAAGAGARTSLVVLLDNSFSMEAGDALRSNFTEAREAAAALVGRLPAGSEAAVLGLAGPLGPLETPSYDLGGVRRALAEASGGFGLAEPPPAMERAAGLFETRMQHADRELVVVSDFQRASWGPEGASARARVRDLLQAQAVPPRLVLLRCGRDATENVAVDTVALSRPVAGVGQPLVVRATLRNLGRENYPDLRVYFRVDGRERAVAQLALGPGETGQALFPHTFDAAGSRLLEVSVDADRLAADNAGRLAVPVIDRLPVLLVDGDPNPEPMRGETAFLEIALAPYGAAAAVRERGGAAPADLVRAETVREEAFRAETLARVRVAVLANVRRLRDEDLAATEAFVRDGGGLLVFPGDRADVAWYNERLAADGRGLLPMRLAALEGGVANEEGAASLLGQHFEHPALALFNDPRHGHLRGAQIRAWYRLEPAGAQAADAATRSVLLRLDQGGVFLAEKRYGAGRVLLCAAPCDADWGNLPLRPFYLPLVQELVVHLASQVFPPRNVEVGERLAALWPAGAAGRPTLVTDPDGAVHEAPTVRAGPRALAEHAATTRPGAYLFRSPLGETVDFVVRTPRAESDLSRLSREEVAALARELGAEAVDSAEGHAKLEHRRRHGREVWRPLWAAMLALMFGELALLQWFGRRAP